ncbi:lysozyme inhibitor LprI family protein [Candidatus Halobeggiatoa sp. HSG11]|nr:lysozyme inhibitor LprI family protein [Candidatus Halobeggiatoa sp. HSG11]
MLQKILLPIVLILMVQGVMAKTVSDCENTDDIAKMSSCAEKAYLNSKKELNSKIKTIKSQKDVGSRAKKLLDKAQKSWGQFRWNYCIFATIDMEGEVGYSFHKFECLGNVTKQQIKNLQEYIEGLDV